MNEHDSTTTNRNETMLCSACGGNGYQMNIKTGMNEPCKVCHGTGVRFSGKYVITC